MVRLSHPPPKAHFYDNSPNRHALLHDMYRASLARSLLAKPQSGKTR